MSSGSQEVNHTAVAALARGVASYRSAAWSSAGVVCSLVAAAALAGPAMASLPSNCSQSGSTVTCTYTGAGTYSFTVPGGVSSLDVEAAGARGGSGAGGPEGFGADVRDSAVPVTANDVLSVVVGGVGGAGTLTTGGAGGTPGGGGPGGDYPDGNTFARGDGGGGGGYSGLFDRSNSPLVIGPGGGGGGGGATGGAGGFGGPGDNEGQPPVGQCGDSTLFGCGGGGGSSSAGGFGGSYGSGCAGATGTSGDAGSSLAGGRGGYSGAEVGSSSSSGGGGGGGYYGGGGGGGACSAGGGGGGSSFPVSGPVSSSYTASAASVTIRYTPPRPADLSITNQAASSVVSGNKLTYTITATNTGGQTAPGVAVSDQLPPGVRFNSMSTTNGTCTRTTSGTPKTQDGNVTCSVGTLAGGSSATVTIVVTPTKPGTLNDTASVTATGISADSDDSATATTTVTGT